MRPRTWARRATIFAATALLLVAVACGGSGEDDPKTASGGTASGGAVAGGLTVVGKDNSFEPANVTVKANQEIVLTFDNKGAAVHNWHVLNVKGTDGKEITTTLIAGGKTEAIKFTIDKPGTYDVQCDVHPADMRGRLTVE